VLPTQLTQIRYYCSRQYRSSDNKRISGCKPNSSNNRSRNSLEITTILVGSGATTPVVDTFEQVYNENTEWTTTSTGSLVNFSAVNNPIKGIVNATMSNTS
jgi:hypothetical protein